MSKIQSWADELSLLDDEDRLMYLIDIAKKPTSLQAELRPEDRF